MVLVEIAISQLCSCQIASVSGNRGSYIKKAKWIYKKYYRKYIFPIKDKMVE